jgi:hypothetical protein
MKKAITLLMVLSIAGCISEQRRWYDRLNAVDAGRISDSAIWAISEDHYVVREIERSDSAARVDTRERRTADSLFTYGEKDTQFGGYGSNSHQHLHIDTISSIDTGRAIADSIIDATK